MLAGFREQDMPLSAIHLDIDYMDGYRVFTVNRERFPSLASLAQELEDAGVKIVTIIDPGVKSDPGYDVFQEGLRRDAFCLCQMASCSPGSSGPDGRSFRISPTPRLVTGGENITGGCSTPEYQGYGMI